MLVLRRYGCPPWEKGISLRRAVCGESVVYTHRIQMSVLMRGGRPLCFLIFYCTFVLSYEYGSFINRMKRILTIRKESQQGKPV